MGSYQITELEQIVRTKTLSDLRDNTYCRLQCSDINGIGVFCIKAIPYNTNPFGHLGCAWENRAVIPVESATDIDSNVKKFMDDIYPLVNDEYHITATLNRMTVGFYMNHSDDYNMFWDDSVGEFWSVRDINAGEELVIDYNTLGCGRTPDPSW